VPAAAPEGSAIMLAMQTLRQARFLARLVLVWFALALGAAIASPLVKPQAIELVCASGGAMKLIVKSDDGSQAPASHTLDCPLCATVGAPPPLAQPTATLPDVLAHVLLPIAAAHIAGRTAAPLPARGPPTLS